MAITLPLPVNLYPGEEVLQAFDWPLAWHPHLRHRHFYLTTRRILALVEDEATGERFYRRFYDWDGATAGQAVALDNHSRLYLDLLLPGGPRTLRFNGCLIEEV